MTSVSRVAVGTSMALSVLVVLLLLAVAGEHVRRTRRLARDTRRSAALMPVVHALLDGEAVGRHDAVDPLFDELVLDLLPQLRGADRDTLTAVLLDRGVVDRAAEDLDHRAAWRRGRAVTLLGNAASIRHTPMIVDLLHDPVADVRCAAARALGKTGDPAATAPLLESLTSATPVPAGIVGMAVLDIGTPALPELRSALGSAVPVVRGLAAELLGLHGDPRAVHPLTGLLADPQEAPELRRSAAEALGRIGVRSATSTLCAVLDAGRRPALQCAAATALGRIGDPAGLDALVVGLDAPDREVRAVCADALLASGAPGRSRLAARAAAAAPPADPTATAVLAGRLLPPVPRPRERQTTS